jgi:hypothetical protein
MNEPLDPTMTAPKKNNNTIIIIAVVAVVLCCCCIAVLVLGYQFGDQILESLGVSLY